MFISSIERGEKPTQKRLFDPSMMVHFRKRFPASSIAEINEELYRRTHDDNKLNDDSNKPGDGVHSGSVDENAQSNLAEPTENSGVLIVDATCAPSDIRYPQDLSLLNECRENTEAMIDIVNLRQPHVRTIVRGKAGKRYEFG